MTPKIIVVLFTIGCMGMAGAAAAQMSSTNYRITTTVVSGGGGPMGSTNFQMNATLGQPSPLIDPADPPWSTHYDLLTGFWYTIDAGLDGCRWDIEPPTGDGDVDGADLAEFLNAFSASDLEEFLLGFGRMDCMP